MEWSIITTVNVDVNATDSWKNYLFMNQKEQYDIPVSRDQKMA